MEKIPSIMVIHKHVDGKETIFTTMSGLFPNNTLVKWLGVIRRGTYKSSSEDSRWAYAPVSDLWPEIEPNSDSRDDGASDEGGKYQENPDDQEQEEAVLATFRNPRRLILGDKRALQLLKIYIENSNDKIFFIKNRSTGSAQAKWYLVHVDMDQSYPVTMKYCRVYRCQWYIIHHEDCTNRPITECSF